MELTCVWINVKPRRHAVSVHDAVFDLSVDAHVGVVGLDAQHERPRRLVLQDGGVQAVVLTLTGQIERLRKRQENSAKQAEQTGATDSFTSWKTGLLLLMSLIPTMTWVELLRGYGPPDALSSVAVMLRTYCGPLNLGGGLRLSLMIPTNKHFSL